MKSCQHPCGGFGASVNHDPCMIYSLSAVQILCLLDAKDEINTENLVNYISGLQVSVLYLCKMLCD